MPNPVMVKVIIESRGIEQALKFNRELSKSLPEIHMDFLREMAVEIIVDAATTLQKQGHVVTEELLRSIQILDETDDSVTVGTDADHAVFIEFGRGPVFAPVGKVLHWIDPDTGEDVFAKSAKATEPSPFMQPAITKKTKRFQGVYVEKATKKLESFKT